MSPGRVKFGQAARARFAARPMPVSSSPPHHTGTPLAACPNFTLPGDISATSRYFAEDITAPFMLDDGHLPVPAGPGTGVEIIPDVLARLTVDTELLR